MKETNIINELKKRNLNPNEWVTIDTAIKKSKYSKKQIQKLSETGNERIGKIKIKNNVLYNLKHILQYEASHQKPTPIFDPVWDEITFDKGEYFYPIKGYDCKYCISNKLKIVNMSNGQILTPTPDIKDKKLTGYQRVSFVLNGKKKAAGIHAIVGRVLCDNVLNKSIFHHINPKKINGLYDNNKNNILPVWEEQHKELHKLLRSGKKEEYKKMVKAIKEENSQKIYKIPHPDFKDDNKYNYYMWLSSDGYKAYKNKENILANMIVGEFAETKQGGLENE